MYFIKVSSDTVTFYCYKFFSKSVTNQLHLSVAEIWCTFMANQSTPQAEMCRPQGNMQNKMVSRCWINMDMCLHFFPPPKQTASFINNPLLKWGVFLIYPKHVFFFFIQRGSLYIFLYFFLFISFFNSAFFVLPSIILLGPKNENHLLFNPMRLIKKELDNPARSRGTGKNRKRSLQEMISIYSWSPRRRKEQRYRREVITGGLEKTLSLIPLQMIERSGVLSPQRGP